MNCMEALQEQLNKCPPCVVRSSIIEFEQIPEKDREHIWGYDKNKHIVLYCQKCRVLKIMPDLLTITNYDLI
jgi:hypothetical protein